MCNPGGEVLLLAIVRIWFVTRGHFPGVSLILIWRVCYPNSANLMACP